MNENVRKPQALHNVLAPSGPLLHSGVSLILHEWHFPGGVARCPDQTRQHISLLPKKTTTDTHTSFSIFTFSLTRSRRRTRCSARRTLRSDDLHILLCSRLFRLDIPIHRTSSLVHVLPRAFRRSVMRYRRFRIQFWR